MYNINKKNISFLHSLVFKKCDELRNKWERRNWKYAWVTAAWKLITHIYKSHTGLCLVVSHMQLASKLSINLFCSALKNVEYSRSPTPPTTIRHHWLSTILLLNLTSKYRWITATKTTATTTTTTTVTITITTITNNSNGPDCNGDNDNDDCKSNHRRTLNDNDKTVSISDSSSKKSVEPTKRWEPRVLFAL